MPLGTIVSLGVLSQAVLDAVVGILESTSAGAPASQFVTVARPAFDCEFVAVQLSRLADDATTPGGLGAKRRNVFGNIPLPTLDIFVVRCTTQVTNGMHPTDAAKTETALMVQEDAWALWNGLRAVQDEIFDGCTGVYFDYGIPIAERGGYVGWTMSIRSPIEGYA